MATGTPARLNGGHGARLDGGGAIAVAPVLNGLSNTITLETNACTSRTRVSPYSR